MNATAIDDENPPHHPRQLEGCRALCNLLQLPRICPRKKCRRVGACSHHPGYGMRRHAEIVPREVWDWFEDNLRLNDESHGQETIADIEESVRLGEGVYRAWLAGLAAGCAARRMPQAS